MTTSCPRSAGLDTLHNPTTHNTVRYGLQRLQQRRPCPPTMSPSLPKRVCIVGAGASGMSAAYALSKHPDKFVVTVFDKAPVAGGMATSIDIDPSKYGATYINDGVQGCSPAFANTLRMFRILGFESTEVGMQYDSHAPLSRTQCSSDTQNQLREGGQLLVQRLPFEACRTIPEGHSQVWTRSVRHQETGACLCHDPRPFDAPHLSVLFWLW